MAGKTTVTLRIEGKTKTIFEGPVSTCGHRVTTKSGGTHHCDGTNGSANPCSGPTCTTALDDGDKTAKYGFDGPFDKSKDDFDDITTIGGDKASGKYFWARCVNFKPDGALGCHIQVKSGDEVLWAYANVDETKHYLKLTGPTLVVPGEPAIYVVTDGRNGSPVKGASLHGKKTDDKGKVAIVFKKLGAHKLKAEKKPDSIRSNELVVHAVVTFRGPTAKL